MSRPIRLQRDDPSKYAPNHDEVLAALEGAVNYNRWLFSRASPHLGSSVLDAGAGLGVFTEMVAETCETVIAVEPDPAYADFLRERFVDRRQVRVVCMDLVEASAHLDHDVDSVLCLNVLEHVPDDCEALQAIHDVLTPGGRLLLLVPAHEFLASPYDSAVGHQRRYTKQPLEELLRCAGFEVLDARYVNPVGGLGWLVGMRFMRRSTMPMGQLAFFDRLVPLLRSLDRFQLPFGQSLWCLARRS